MEMSSFSDSRLLNKISLSERGLTEVEDGELVEDFNINNVSEEEKKVLRARRFGPVVDDTMPKSVDPMIQRLYKRMQVNKDTRLEALHLHGTDNMKTEDVFAFFSGYTPASIEWLTDKTCNAVWLDQESAAKALKKCSLRIKAQSDDDSDDSDEESINMEDIRCALPPGGVWRRGHASHLAPHLFLRFATYSDRRGNRTIGLNDPVRKNYVFLDEGDEAIKKFRQDSGNPWVDIAREWSYYELRSAKKHDERLPVRDARELLRKDRRIPPPGSTQSSYHIEEDDMDDDEDASSVPNDRVILSRKMQADIEERKILSKKFKALRNSRSPYSVDLRDRLSSKRRRPRYFEDSEEDLREGPPDSYDQDLLNRKRTASESWIRGDSEESESDSEDMHIQKGASDLRSKLTKISSTNNDKKKKKKSCSSSSSKSSSVITKSTKKFVPECPLQIEIVNQIYFERENREE